MKTSSTRARGTRSRSTRRAALLTALCLALTPACAAESDDEQQLTIFAAASLTESFEELVDRFEEDHPGVDVVTSFDSSATLAGQVLAGAPADVVATADSVTMGILEEENRLAEPPVVFARNEMALVVPAGNPAGIDDVEDLENADYVVCARTAPCGDLAERILSEARIEREPRSLEVDVKAVLTKVSLGEADAGLVYVTDVVAAEGDVEEIPLPPSASETTDDLIAVVRGSDEAELAQEFTELVLSPEGGRVLEEAGFQPGRDSDSSP